MSIGIIAATIGDSVAVDLLTFGPEHFSSCHCERVLYLVVWAHQTQGDYGLQTFRLCDVPRITDRG